MQYSDDQDAYNNESYDSGIVQPQLFGFQQPQSSVITTEVVKETPPTDGRKSMNLQPVEGQSVLQLKYQTCDKGGMHQNELLNLVCLQKNCVQDSAICCVCMEESHLSHHIRPLKLVVQHARRAKVKVQNIKDKLPVLKEEISKLQNEHISVHEELQKAILPTFQAAKDMITSYNTRTKKQVQTQKIQDSLMETISTLQHEEMDEKQFSQLVCNLQSCIPSFDSVHSLNTNEQQQLQYIEISNSFLYKQFQTTANAVVSAAKKYNEILEKTVQAKILSKKEVIYSFDNTLKHQNIVIEENIAKSQGTSDYNYALVGPNLEPSKFVQKFAFKIVQSSSNWVGVGLCHQKTAKQNGYTFNYSDIEHGGYLISSNGGSWSTLSSEDNNTVKAFRFKTGDVIFIFVDFEGKTITFQKKKKSKKSLFESYVLNFEIRDNDPLHLCALFYYGGDKIQYLGKAQDNGLNESDLPDNEPADQNLGYMEDDYDDWSE